MTHSSAAAAVLRRAAALIDDLGWCQRTNAQAANGKTVLSDDPDAARWCAYGAIRRVAAGPESSPRAVVEACHVLAQFIDPEATSTADITTWNDDDARTKAEVVAALRDAANAAEQR